MDSDFTYTWSKIEGPGNVMFSNTNGIETTANFSREGVYKIQLKAVDKVTLYKKYYTTLIDEMIITVIENCTDVDGDGFCADDGGECVINGVNMDNNPAIPTFPGTPCNDSNDDTTNDIIQADGCECKGVDRIISDFCSGSTVNITYGNGQVVVSNAPSGSTIKLFSGTDIYYDAIDANLIGDICYPCSSHTFPNIPEGNYIIQVIGTSCNSAIYVSPTVLDENNRVIEDPDNDGDNLVASQDCDDNNPNLPVSQDTDCDDGDQYTDNDMIRAGSCACYGTFIDKDLDGDGIPYSQDCDDSDNNIGTSLPAGTLCNDGDPNTINDKIQSNGCDCQGEPIDTTNTGGGTPPLTNTLWTLSNDGNYIYREGKTKTSEFWADKLMVEANLSTNGLLEGNNQLMPLEGLRGYIEQNKHLPNIPKAATVINSGLNVGMLSVLRIQKIEELTAYLLEMNERLVELEEENQDLIYSKEEFFDCTGLTVTGGNDGSVTIENIPPNAILDYNGQETGWAFVDICNGNCSSTEVFSGLAAGDYNLRIERYSPSYCQESYPFTITTGGGNTGGGNTGGGTPTDCEGVEVIDGGLSVIVNNIPSNAKIEITGTTNNWGALVLVCDGDCNITETISGLVAGFHQVKIQIPDPYCYRNADITVTEEGTNTGGGNNNGGGNNTELDTTTVGLWTANNTDNYIYRDGKVMVMDTFMAEKIIVEVINFPDYVFEKDYNLMPLDKLQQYISTNKHLPNIPKGASIEQKGMNIGDISILQMEKIEELTLYLLEMNERLKRLEEKNNKLRQLNPKKE